MVTNSTDMLSPTSTIIISINNWNNDTNATNNSNQTAKFGNSTSFDELIDNKFIQLGFCALYASIFILGIFGNILVCFIVLRNNAMKTVTNIFITNLALSDILLCVLCVPFTPTYTFMKKWIFGRLLCHLVSYAQACSVYISTFTLTAIAVDRFFVIIYPFHPRMQMKTCISIIIGIWILALLLTGPYGAFTRLYVDGDLVYCEESWPSEEYRKVFGSVTSMLQFLLPFLIISICYICVSIQLAGRAKAKPGTKTSRKEEADRERKRRTNCMLISMVAVFGLSWLPLNVVNILNDFYDMTEWKLYNFIFFIAHSIAMSSTCYNPFLYAWLNENFRKEFKLVLPCFNPSRGLSRNALSGGGQRWMREQTLNGNNDTTVHESLLTSRVSVSQLSMKDISQQCNAGKNQTGATITTGSACQRQQQSVQFDHNIETTTTITIPQKDVPTETKILPTGVIETNFES